jgi:crossover junction endodeoxyribonuclease RusA
LSSSFTFTVYGKPAPQGSKRHLGKGVMVESSNRVKPWRQDIKHAAERLLPKTWHAILPMRLKVSFLFARPQSHYRANGQLKPSAPRYCTTRIGDLDKLVRALCDALQGLCYLDDSQIIEINATRRYASIDERPSAIVTIEALDA